MNSEFNSRLGLKAEARKELKAKLKVFTSDTSFKASAEGRIVSQIKSLIVNSGAVVAGFVGMSSEPDLSALYSLSSYSFVFPKLISLGSGDEIQFMPVREYLSEPWNVSPLGFKHPSSNSVVPAEDIDVMLVPGLGFSAFGDRLGRGKGFYDRYLSRFNGLKIGICFDCQWTEQPLPTESWDIRMNYIITENRCVEIEG
ncbi:MAG: 5-formyltetrahydrofolate cyclo-ligase [Bdellovibrionaceae bacterium]|nr:5-formyltetrahydrofolate cyclo-ligase [Pseudobdellovibrionaceae bacterium]